MTKRIKVAVSPFYGGTEWTDEFTGVTFKKNVNGMNVYSIPADSDMTGIAAAIRLNALILFEGEINQDYIDASEGYKEPGRWTETVIQQTKPVEENPPADGTGEEDGTGAGDGAGEDDEIVEDPPAVDPEPDSTEPEETPEEETTEGETTEGEGTETPPVDDGENPEASGVQTFSAGETPEYVTVNPDDMTVDELSAHTEKYNIPVEGTGSNGNAIKADYIAAIKAYQA